MYYFAYGSNMSLARLLKRVPSAVPLGCHILKEHDLRFHKWCADGSGKCDAYFTANTDHAIHGALFEIDPNQKAALDRAEGLGDGYDEKEVTVIAGDQSSIRAMTYVATNIVENLQPYSWYLNHVLIGANETSLPIGYIQRKSKSSKLSRIATRKGTPSSVRYTVKSKLYGFLQILNLWPTASRDFRSLRHSANSTNNE